MMTSENPAEHDAKFFNETIINETKSKYFFIRAIKYLDKIKGKAKSESYWINFSILSHKHCQEHKFREFFRLRNICKNVFFKV